MLYNFMNLIRTCKITLDFWTVVYIVRLAVIRILIVDITPYNVNGQIYLEFKLFNQLNIFLKYYILIQVRKSCHRVDLFDCALTFSTYK